MKPPILILQAPGTNRDHAAARACAMSGGAPRIVPWAALWDGDVVLDDYRMLVLPGGFSFGDDLGAGRLWAALLRHRFGDALRQFIDQRRPVLGICNGFQALLKAGFLPALSGAVEQVATLTHNASGHFECRWVALRADPTSACIFTAGIDQDVACPVAHAEGRFVAPDAVLDDLERRGLVALRYAAHGAVDYPHNPNGSARAIAGICNPAGNVLGLMPHPEDHVRAEQHPLQAGHDPAPGRGLGLQLFARGVAYAAG